MKQKSSIIFQCVKRLTFHKVFFFSLRKCNIQFWLATRLFKQTQTICKHKRRDVATRRIVTVVDDRFACRTYIFIALIYDLWSVLWLLLPTHIILFANRSPPVYINIVNVHRAHQSVYISLSRRQAIPEEEEASAGYLLNYIDRFKSIEILQPSVK